MKKRYEVNDELLDWNEIKERHEWATLLIGNGASCAVWEKFRYGSLYETACDPTLDHSLSSKDQVLFRKLGTENFEAVLSALATAKMVAEALKTKHTRIDRRYKSIQRALACAVKSVHIPWPLLSEERKQAINQELRRYKTIFSTNYDLILYWSIMFDNDGFKDFFWSGRFDPSDVEIWGDCTTVIYLHGGLHLYKSPIGGTYKRVATANRNLLDLFGSPYLNGAVPLIISEGTSDDKLKAISRSDYLSFAYSRLAQAQGPAVVFGHSLGESDKHLIDAMRRWGGAKIAMSMRRAGSVEIVSRKTTILKELPDAEIMFFDASTHPLGRDELIVSDDTEM